MFKRRVLGAVALTVMLTATQASAETLREALALAYRTNPTLLAQRADQRALDESYAQLRASLGPSVDLSSSVGYSRTWPEDSGVLAVDDEGNSASVTLSLSQTLYSGGRIARGIDAVLADIEGGREGLRSVEQQILANVIQAYSDVLRDIEILAIREENVTVLRRQLDEAGARFEVGEITRTDVAQAEARLADAQSALSSARAQLAISRAAYAAVVGQAPTDLAPVPLLPEIPADFDQALDVALDANPDLRARVWALRSAEAAVAEARAAYRPSVGISASYGTQGFIEDPLERQSLDARATLSVPLFTSGLNRSRVAAALERANAAQIRVEGERRQVLVEVSNAFAQVIAARDALAASEEQVRAASIAAEGVRQEAQVGLRTTLDVLNQELELRNAQIARANARRNLYVAQASLLLAMGQLEAEALETGVELYDPEDNFDDVRDRGLAPLASAIEALDRVAAPGVRPAVDLPNAPIDDRLNDEIIQTAPR